MRLETHRLDEHALGSPDLDSEQTLVLAFFAPELSGSPRLTELFTRYPRAVKLGCSTAGEILGSEIHDHSIAVAVLRFESTRIKYAESRIDSMDDSARAGRDIATQLNGPELRGVFVLSDGTHVNGSELLLGMNSELKLGVPVSGGLAADGDRFGKTCVLGAGGPTEKLVTAVGFYGEQVRLGHGSRGGWDIFGPERVITRSTANTLYEIDSEPALALYRRYLGERQDELPGAALLFPLSLRMPGSAEPLVRTILAIDEAAQSMTFAGDVPQGCLVQLMHANFDRLIEGASKAAEQSRPPSVQVPRLAIAISCVGRRLVLRDRAEEEVEAALHGLPADTAMLGYYSYGEISPSAGARCQLHNQTMTMTTLWEEP